MFVIFKKRLAIDTSSEAIRRMTDILEENGIKYEIRTIRSRGSIGTALDAQAYARGNLAMYKGSSQPSMVYQLYVDRKDFERAKDLIF
jgi:hypothetical protein